MKKDNGFNGLKELNVMANLLPQSGFKPITISTSLYFKRYDITEGAFYDSQHTNPRRSVAWGFVGWQHFGACA
ncbi:MAG: hypothetical protein ACP5JU_02885, partial [Minisyncoccia bacterium]